MFRSYIFTQADEEIPFHARFSSTTNSSFITVGSTVSNDFGGGTLEISVLNEDNTYTVLRTITDLSNREDRAFEILIPQYMQLAAKLVGGSAPNLQIAFRPYL